jgi:hypothetical protein
MPNDHPTRPWLLRQWDDIKGNAKFALIAGAAVAMIDWLRNGPSWQIFGTLALLIISLFFLLVAESKNSRLIGYSSLILGIAMALLFIGDHEIKRQRWGYASSNAATAHTTGSNSPAMAIGPISGTNIQVQQAGRDIYNGASTTQLVEIYKHGYSEGSNFVAQKTGTWPEAFGALASVSPKSQNEPIATRVFSLLREKGARIDLGCPGEKCLSFELGDLITQRGELIQEIFLSGKGTGIMTVPDGDLLFAIPYNVALRSVNAGLLYNYETKQTKIQMALHANSTFELFTTNAAITFTVSDIRADSLKIKLEIKPPDLSQFLGMPRKK